MSLFAKYDERGCVLFVGDVPENMLALQGESVFIGEIDGALVYVSAGNKLPRPANPANLTGYELHNLPVPCMINQREYACSDASAALKFTYPGLYRMAAYPPLEDFADAWFHLRTGNNERMKTYLKLCAIVKNTFRK